MTIEHKPPPIKFVKTPVLVTDSHRGIYFGWLVAASEDLSSVQLEGMRHCYSYAVPAQDGERGCYSLATVGPAPGSRVGPPVTAIVRDVVTITDVSPEAVEAWRVATWA